MDFRMATMHAVTEYDRREKAKHDGPTRDKLGQRHYYNVYALPQYLRAAGIAADAFEDGADLEKAIRSAFHGRLATFAIRSVRKGMEATK